jgi:hypothetical protein
MPTISDMQLLSDWIQPGNVGDDGGGSSKPNGKFVMIPGSPATFVAAGIRNNNNGYFYRKVPEATNAMTYFEYALSFSFPSQASIDACQALEWELQQNVGGQVYNMAWQADLKGSKLFRPFDFNKTLWTSTAIPVTTLDLRPGMTNSIIGRFLRHANTLTHLSIDINGVSYPVDVTRPSTPKVESDYLNAAFQMDTIDPSHPYMVLVDKMSLTMAPTSL